MTAYSSYSTLPRPSTQAHPASLVDPASHSPALLELVGIELTGPVIYYLCDSVLQIVNAATDGYFDKRTHFPLFCNFADLVISEAEISTSTTLVALVYLARVRRLNHLVIDEDEEDGALERLLLGALVVANKYTREDAMKNLYWALASRIFATYEVSRFERDFLALLEWDLSVSEEDLMCHHRDAMAMASLARAVSRRPARCRQPSVASEVTIRAVPSLVPSAPVSAADQLARSSSPSPSPITLQTPHLRHVELAVVQERRCPQRGPGHLRRGKGIFRQLYDGLRIPGYRRVQQVRGV
ncbi:Cyclin N-terminal domain-containing protein [Mycena chlorophos]|uniref:Cyclin N-terminal domain-containing protein n=1 Tax=Mycena chlorophos TaxID=658473 RepID=A0A8H6SV17_MYCCL|nr:Cyclin N-terminal domain-containing protein [Mycena chlorophos]